MKQIDIRTKSKNYPIFIGAHILKNVTKYYADYDQILFLTNDTLWKLYSHLFQEIEEKGKTEYYILKDGENQKHLSSISHIYDFMVEKHFSRKSLILCFGGGVICDMGGFVAASFMRGIDCILLPTSLLAQVDASIGGKVAVNHPEGKNLIGFFYPPKAVFLDISLLKTLEQKEWKSGMAEVIKHSILSKTEDYADFLSKEKEKIRAQEEKSLIALVEQSCLIKQAYVEEDMEEKGIRAFLNFGHTYAHALEKIFHYEHLSHGEAVAKGCLCDLQKSLEEQLISEAYFHKIKSLFQAYEIDTSPIFIPIETLFQAMMQDKKNAFQKINTVLLKFQENKKQFFLQEVDQEFFKKYTVKEKNSYLKAVIDIGTNSCRLFIAQVDFSGKTIEKELYHEVQIVQLGEKVHETKKLQEQAILRTLACLQQYRATLDSYGCAEVYCFATSATRDAQNRDEFLAKVKRETGITVHCISGEEEAHYNFQGVSLAFSNRILIVDIGGGSTEFTLGEKESILFQKSLNIGAVRTTELFFETQEYSEEKIKECKEWIWKHLQSLSEIQGENFQMIGVAGTASTQISVREHMEVYDRKKVHLSRLTKEEIQQNLMLFLSKDLEERKKIIGLEPKRANVIIAGSLILLTILEYFQEDCLSISEFDNLTGAMIL